MKSLEDMLDELKFKLEDKNKVYDSHQRDWWYEAKVKKEESKPSVKEILDNIDDKEIESYLRKKKLEKLKKIGE